MITKDKLGIKIRELRLKIGKSQEELGKILKRSHAAVSDIERGKTDLSVTDLSTIANFFNVPVSFFLEDDSFQYDFASTHYRDAKNITKEEEETANEIGIKFIEYARKLAQNK